MNLVFVCSSGGRDFEKFVVAVGGGGSKGGQFMTWSGMQSPFGGEPQGLYTREKLYTYQVESSVNHLRVLAGEARHSEPTYGSTDAPMQTKWSRLKKYSVFCF